ncbi:hypothetical protein [Flaviaesturariibacter aridisoli]|uniref:RHS repeat protein n=1 Tax=Flaviaesturariibacter aridisoli TaxID=2545761 RepID=A0A4R4E3D7_9BACT|nr:hypothetical protein [Flaviaesturariibacter aridisoli]TCZ70520.1 hypothetical protein E0486_11225 [Flaviaesturariibacter aridisoli]
MFRPLLLAALAFSASTGSAQYLPYDYESFQNNDIDTGLVRRKSVASLQVAVVGDGVTLESWQQEFDGSGKVLRTLYFDRDQKRSATYTFRYNPGNLLSTVEAKVPDVLRAEIYRAEYRYTDGKVSGFDWLPSGDEVTYQYAQDRLVRAEWRRGRTGIGPRLAYRARTDFRYDAGGRLTSTRTVHYVNAEDSTGELFSNRTYTYAGGRLLRDTEEGIWGVNTILYRYDAAGRLTRKTSDRLLVTNRYYSNGLLRTRTERKLFGGGRFSETVFTYTWKQHSNKSPR